MMIRSQAIRSPFFTIKHLLSKTVYFTKIVNNFWGKVGHIFSFKKIKGDITPWHRLKKCFLEKNIFSLYL